MSVTTAKILLVDDHDLFRSGMRMILDSHRHADRVVYEAASGEDCIDIVKEQSIDVVFMDYHLPGLDGISTSLQLLQIDESLKIIMLTGSEDRPLSKMIFKAGISGYMTKSSATEEVTLAIDCVMQGQKFLSKELEMEVILDSASTPKNPSGLDVLSRRELQVALLLMSGHKPSAVGTMLFLSPKSVSTYKRRAFEKLKVDSLVDLIDIGRVSGFVGDSQRRRAGSTL